ncbi:MAG: hypothetical protein HFJ45_04295 [Clostridia bacterium]|nr:hypothetical protein [Clostridia bacterium]
MRKYLKLMVLLIIVFVILCTHTQAFSYSSFDYAFTMGIVHSDGKDTSKISERANYWYGTAGGGNKTCYGLTKADYYEKMTINEIRDTYSSETEVKIEDGYYYYSSKDNKMYYVVNISSEINETRLVDDFQYEI